jgi:CDP-diacylglycerol---serine O-phosphatidyltransferase
LSFNGKLAEAAFFIIAAAVFDFFDGMSARLLKSNNIIGKDLDSLADVVSFGAAPAFIIPHLKEYYYSLHATPMYVKGHFTFFYEETVMIFAFVMVIFSAIRLAIFNNDTRQTTSFIGVPTPANALFIISFALIAKYQPDWFPLSIVEKRWIMGGICLFLSYLLISPLPLFALKFKQWGFKGNEVRYLFVLAAALLIVALQFVAIPVIIILYILLSLILNFAKKSDS